MIYLALGTNLGDRHAHLDRALNLLDDDAVCLIRRSSCYETEPRDVPDQPWFLNMVVECRCDHPADVLMRRLLEIEKQMGRDRSHAAIARGPRLIDLDLLLYENEVIQTPELTLPHPRMLERRFVLEPLVELAPDLRDPRTGKLIAEALAAVRDQQVRKLD